jgi:hypothetical protein
MPVFRGRPEKTTLAPKTANLIDTILLANQMGGIELLFRVDQAYLDQNILLEQP